MNSMDSKTPSQQGKVFWFGELCSIATLLALLAYFLRVSWRKWPDPIVDSSQQWYAAWRISAGDFLFQSGGWNYGPFSAYFNGFLFRIFGPTLNALFTANLLIYGAILALAYAAFRRAWGRMGAFAACAVFIAVFSFSHLTSVGNYNYASPYSHEATHGMLLMFVALFVVAAWCRKKSKLLAFCLGTCGGIAAVLKPEFMLASAVLGAGALVIRLVERRAVSPSEWAALAAGTMWPTLAFTIVFWRHETFRAAFADASNAWWRVLVHPVDLPGFSAGQAMMAGFDHPWRNGWGEIKAGVCALVVIAATWSIGWFINMPASKSRIALALVLCAIALTLRLQGGWFWVGRCLPLLTLLIVVLTGAKCLWQYHENREMTAATGMQWMLALFAAAMLARMALFARVYHFGFFQAAPAAMVLAAVMTAEIPRWTGKRQAGIVAAACCALLVLTLGCVSIAAKSNGIRKEQTQQVGTGPDRFYAFNREVDTTPILVDWVLRHMGKRGDSLLVLPDGLSINFIAGCPSPMPDVGDGRPDIEKVEQLRRSPPDCVAIISLDLTEHGISDYGAPGKRGHILLQWVKQNYVPLASWGDPYSATNSKGASILRQKTF
jgi:hypothetical protein